MGALLPVNELAPKNPSIIAPPMLKYPMIKYDYYITCTCRNLYFLAMTQIDNHRFNVSNVNIFISLALNR